MSKRPMQPRWQRHIHLASLSCVLVLILSLAYKITENQKLTQAQNLQIQADAWSALKRQTYGELAAMVQQDYVTYTAVQEKLSQSGDLSSIVYASNLSYETRIMESLGRYQAQHPEEHLQGAIFFDEGEASESVWFVDFPFQNSVAPLFGDLMKSEEQASPLAEKERTSRLSETLDPSPESIDKPKEGLGNQPAKAYLRLLNVVNQKCLLFVIPLAETSKVICVLDAEKELDGGFAVQATDPKGTLFGRKLADKAYTYEDWLYGLKIHFSLPNRSENHLPLTLLIAAIVLGLMMYQFHSVIREAQNHELTGLPNMRTFERHFKAVLQQPGTTFLLFLDLRNLKLINTIFMEEQADEVINAFAKTLRKALGRHDKVIHRSGDEFFVILNVTQSHLIAGILERLRHVFADQTIRLGVRQAKDPFGKEILLYGEPLEVGEYVTLPIGFRLGGLEIDERAAQIPRAELLEAVNLLAEKAKCLEGVEAEVSWLVHYKHEGKEVECTSKDVPQGLHLVELSDFRNEA